MSLSRLVLEQDVEFDLSVPDRCLFIYFESIRKDASDFAKDRYFNGCSDNRSVQENFDNFLFSRICQ